jgi:CTD small phosphatase-like protein 2
MEEYFELVIFTAGTEEYADWALNFLDNVVCIKHRLYRQHALPFNGYYVKDLSRLGRDLTKTIIVDNIAENFQM